VIVAINLRDIPAKRPELVGQGVQVEDLRNGPEARGRQFLLWTVSTVSTVSTVKHSEGS
jgi:hypothetical protein